VFVVVQLVPGHLRECQLGGIMAGVSLAGLARALLEVFHVRLV
jgi:hypothetical protein